MPLGTQTIQEADKEVGVVESPPHSNCTKFIKEFGYPVCAAWCAMFVSCMIKRVFGRWILQTASVWQARADAQAGKNGMKWHPKNSSIGVGWAVLFDFGQRGNPGDMHISLVRGVGTWNLNPGSGSFQTDGGNESDAVRQQWRDGKYIMGFIEFPYDGHIEFPTFPQEDDMGWNDDRETVINAIGEIRTQMDAVFKAIGRSEDDPINTNAERRADNTQNATNRLEIQVAALTELVKAGATDPNGKPIDVDAIVDAIAKRLAN